MSTEPTAEVEKDEPMLIIKPERHLGLCVAIPARLFHEIQGKIHILEDVNGHAARTSEYRHVSDSPEVRTLPANSITAIKTATRLAAEKDRAERRAYELQHQAEIDRARLQIKNIPGPNITWTDRTSGL